MFAAVAFAVLVFEQKYVELMAMEEKQMMQRRKVAMKEPSNHILLLINFYIFQLSNTAY